jgi:hypothetical protein
MFQLVVEINRIIGAAVGSKIAFTKNRRAPGQKQKGMSEHGDQGVGF